MSVALDRWEAALRARAIPQRILDAAPESPWGFPSESFRRRAATAVAATEETVTTRRAAERLPEEGTVLDVGVGGGATSLPLAARAVRIVGVDEQADMLEAFTRAARAAGVEPLTVLGRWPDVADGVAGADVVVSGHTAYNVADLGPFARALDTHARKRVVLELTDRHPLGWMQDLWRRFHGITIANEPGADLATEALAELGFSTHREDREVADDPSAGGFERRDAAVAFVRRRLCLTPDRDAEVAEALGDRLRERSGIWSAGPATRTFVTLWWDTDQADLSNPRS